MPFKLLNGAASPANCARKIPGPLMVLIVPSTPPSIHDELLRRTFFRPVRTPAPRPEEHMPQVHPDPLIPVGLRDLVHRVAVAIPRIIDEHANAAQPGANFFDSGLQRGDVPNVASDEKWRRSRLSLNLSSQRPARILRHIHTSHPSPLPGKRAHELRTNPAASTGDDEHIGRQTRVAIRDTRSRKCPL